MKKMSQKQKNRNNVISEKRMAKAKKRKPHLKRIAESMRKINLSYRRIERANSKAIKLSKQAQVAKAQGPAL